MKTRNTLLLVGVGTAIAYFLWRQANDPKRIMAQGDAALTQAAALQRAGQPVPESMKQAILKAHGGGAPPTSDVRQQIASMPH